MAENKENDELSPVINIGTCGLHTVHNSLKAGIKSSWWIVGKAMKAMWKLLNESPARREKCVAPGETSLFPLSFYGHRWCENKGCRTSRTIMGWLCQVFEIPYRIV